MRPNMWPKDQIENLASRLDGASRILFWGDMGTGKSTLALALAKWFGRHRTGGQILSLDPGSPAFGVPGAVSRGWWVEDTLHWADCQALCSLDAARFRLPLLVAAGRLCALAEQAAEKSVLLIDPPGVVRGVGGSELVMALSVQLHVEAVVVIQREEDVFPLASEVNLLSDRVVRISSPPKTGRPSKSERARHRTQLWDAYLKNGTEENFRLGKSAMLGTPPPIHEPDAWTGRQAALLDARGNTLKLGEVVKLVQGELTLRLPAGPRRPHAAVCIRDAGRNAQGLLETVPRKPSFFPARQIPAAMPLRVIPRHAGSAPVTSRVGQADATLVGGVFGDPLVHVRMRNQKRGILFDLGDPNRLSARVAHQVETVCLSHAHLDHIGGFVWFLRSRIGSFDPCTIFGPPKTIQRIEHFLGAITWDRIEDNAPVFHVCETDGARLKRARLQPAHATVFLPEMPVKNNLLKEDDNLSISAVICDHNIPSAAYALAFRTEICVRKDRLAASGLEPGPWLGTLKQCIAAQVPDTRIELPDGTRRTAGELARDLTWTRPGKKLVYAADMADTTANRKKVIDLARNAHTLFCETAFAQAEKSRAAATQHLTTLAAAEIAREAGVERLVPFHFSKRYEKDPNVLYAEILSAAGPVRVVGHFG